MTSLVLQHPPPTSRQLSSEEKPFFRQSPSMVNQKNVFNCDHQKSSEHVDERKEESSIPALQSSSRNSNDSTLSCSFDAERWVALLKEKRFHRIKEELKLIEEYEKFLKADNKSCSLLLVTGRIGTGKTSFIQDTLQERVQRYGGYFIRGKFDQLCRPEPYRGFVTALTEFTNQVEERGTKHIICNAIHNAVGKYNSSVLTDMIPALERIVGWNDTDNSSSKGHNNTRHHAKIDDPIQRFVFVFRLFMKAIASLERPIVLLLDDLQWADSCSLDLLTSIVIDIKETTGLVVIGTCDDSLISIDSYLTKKLQEIEHVGDITNIALHNVEQDTLNQFIGNLFQISRLDDAEDLGRIVFRQTYGNLFYVVEFLRWLQENFLLSYDKESGIWVWDAEEIQSTIDVCTAEDFLAGQLEQLSMDLRDVLKVAACLGFVDEKLIEYVLGKPIGNVLAEASGRGLLLSDGIRRNYTFRHDEIQHVAYSLIPEGERELFHLEIGRRLWRKLKNEELDQNIFVVLSQMNIGKRLITRERERYSVASLCLHAGTKAAKSSTFRTAAVYLNLGIDLLQDRGWRDEYDLTLAIYNAAAEMAMCTTNFDATDDLVQTIIKKARVDGDKVHAQMTQISAMGMNGKQQEALDLGIAVVAKLGEAFPRRLCAAHMMREFKAVQRLLRNKTDAQLLGLPSMENEDKLACMQILNVMFLHALLIRPKLSVFIGLKWMKLTLTYGLSMLSAPAYSVYGMICVNAIKDTDVGFRFGELGLKLLQKYETKQYLPRVYAAHYGCIFSNKKPVKESLVHLLYAYRTGIATGDVEFAFLNANLYHFTAYLGGAIPLQQIEQEWRKQQDTMRSLQQESLLRMSMPCMQAIHHFMGMSNDPLASKGDLMDADEMLRYCIKNKLQSGANSINLNGMFVAYVFNNYDLAYIKAKETAKSLCSMPMSFDVVLATFIFGMIALAKAEDGKQTRRNVKKAKKCLKKVKNVARVCPANYLDKRYLLEAELANVRKDDRKAFEKYYAAIALAKKNQFLFHEALANERLGLFLASRSRFVEALSYFQEACDRYAEWGAKAKVERLQAEINIWDAKAKVERLQKEFKFQY